MKNKNIAIIGFGKQGKAQALNLKESGVTNLVIGLRFNSKSRKKAREMGFKVMDIEDAAAWADLVVILVPDLNQKQLYECHLKDHMKQGAALLFAHGLNIHFNVIKPRKDLDVLMVAPKVPAYTVRDAFQKKKSFPTLIAVYQNTSGNSKRLAYDYAKLIGCKKSFTIETTFKEECETDLFGEQVVLCGGLVELMKKGFETLVEAGYNEKIAYIECIYEMKLIVDLIYEGGLVYMNQSISRVAEYGGYVTGKKIIDSKLKDKMKEILKDIQTGKFVKNLLIENKKGLQNLTKMRKQLKEHKAEQIGKKFKYKIIDTNT
jgi:ketol-acid reductoisomerase